MQPAKTWLACCSTRGRRAHYWCCRKGTWAMGTRLRLGTRMFWVLTNFKITTLSRFTALQVASLHVYIKPIENCFFQFLLDVSIRCLTLLKALKKGPSKGLERWRTWKPRQNNSLAMMRTSVQRVKTNPCSISWREITSPCIYNLCFSELVLCFPFLSSLPQLTTSTIFSLTSSPSLHWTRSTIPCCSAAVSLTLFGAVLQVLSGGLSVDFQWWSSVWWGSLFSISLNYVDLHVLKVTTGPSCLWLVFLV